MGLTRLVIASRQKIMYYLYYMWPIVCGFDFSKDLVTTVARWHLLLDTYWLWEENRKPTTYLEDWYWDTSQLYTIIHSMYLNKLFTYTYLNIYKPSAMEHEWMHSQNCTRFTKESCVWQNHIHSCWRPQNTSHHHPQFCLLLLVPGKNCT